MRNRGIEIYILNETESLKSNNNFDIISLISLEGLDDLYNITILLQIHDFISDLILGEKPQIKDLLQTASSIAHQLNHGADIYETYQETFIECYFKTRSSIEFNCNNPVDVIKEGIKKIFNNVKITTGAFCKNVTIKTQNIDMDSTLEKIKQQSGILLQDLENSDRSYTVNLLLAFYSISSAEDLELRQVFLKHRLLNDDLNQFSQNLSKIILNHSVSNLLNLPFDNNWVLDTSYPSKELLKSDNLNLALYIASSYFLEQQTIDEVKIKSVKQKEVTLLDYMYQKQSKKVYDKFHNILVTDYIKLKNEFDQFLLAIPTNIVTSNINVVELLYLIFWRFIMHKSTLVDIKHVDAEAQYTILTNLTIHYKWFYKYSVQKLTRATNITLPGTLKVILERINQKLDQQFSLVQKFGKNYQKFSDNPPPFISLHQIEITTNYNEINRQYNVCDKRNDPKRIIGVFKQHKDLRMLLVQMKSEMHFEFQNLNTSITELMYLHDNLKDTVVDIETLKFELEMLPILDHFLQLQVRNIFYIKNANEVVQNTLLPPDFAGVLSLYANCKDNRLLNEVTSRYYFYLMNSASVKPGDYFEESKNCKVILNSFNPRLTYFINTLLIGGNNPSSITLGNFRHLMEQHRHMSLILSMNLNGILDKKYDYK